MPYKVGAKGSYGCDGYPAVKDTGEVMGCHKTRREAAGQIFAINRSEGNIGKAMTNLKEGDMVIAGEEDEFHVGRVVHIMREGMLGMPGSEYSIAASAEDPALLIQLFEMEDGGLEETEYFMGHKSSEVMAMPSLEANIGMDKSMDEDKKDPMKKEYEGCGCPTCKELNVNCENCPVCQAEEMDDEADSMDAYDNSIGKAKEPNYSEFIKPRRSGSTPSNPRLYARVVQAAKDKFEVYPSAVANSWVVQEYKRRGGTYKSEPAKKGDIWSGSLFDPKGFNKNG